MNISKYSNVNLKLSGICKGEGKIMSNYDVKITPIKEPGYAVNPKYNCPICLAMGCKHRVLRNYPSCAICGIQLNWE